MRMMKLIWMRTGNPHLWLLMRKKKPITPFREKLWLNKQRVNWLSPQNCCINFAVSSMVPTLYRKWVISLWRTGITLVGNPVIPNAQTFRSILCKCKFWSHLWNSRQQSGGLLLISSTSSRPLRHVDGIRAGTRVKGSVSILYHP